MKRNLFLVIITLLFIFNINCVKAETCDNADIERLKQLANMVDISYEWYYNDYYNYGSYDVNIYNITDELYIVDEDKNEYRYSDVNESGFIYDSANDGTTTYKVYSASCNKKLRSITVDLPKFNFYAYYDECEGISGDELDVCDEWYSGDLDYNTFISKVEQYNNSEDNNERKNIFQKYYLHIIVVGVVILVLVTAFVILRRKRSVLK